MSTVVSQDIFQSKLDAIFIGMEGVTGIADDMVIAGRDEMEHDRNFPAFMENCMINNLTLRSNSEKIQFKQGQVSFYGHCWSKQGISLDPKKIKTLNHKNSHWIRKYEIFPRDDQLPQQVQCTQCTPCSTLLCTHTSSHGLCQIQKGKVICYASRALTKTAQNYQNLERERHLGTIWGMEKFPYFLYVKEFTQETKQKPLVSIYKKHMIDICKGRNTGFSSNYANCSFLHNLLFAF